MTSRSFSKFTWMSKNGTEKASVIKFSLVSKSKGISQSNLRLESRSQRKELRTRILTNYKSEVSSGMVLKPGDGLGKADVREQHEL